MEFVEKDTFYQCQFSRMYVYELWKAAPGLATERIRHVSQLLLQMLPWGAENLVDENLCSRVAHLCKKLTEYWKKANRTHKVMVDRYCDWLNIVETVNLSKTSAPSASSTSQAIPDQEDCNNSTSICNALSDISSASRCYLCKATPKEMNSIDECLQKEIDISKLDFGLSPLHARIRFFEYFLHVSYRLHIKKWQVRKDEQELVAQRKKSIQSEFKAKLGLIVDKPRSGGSGTSNDGNTARKFFANSAVLAEITGIQKDLIDRCSTILDCLNSGYKINSDKFKLYAVDTARQLVGEYPWYKLPASVHKVLIHGSEVIDHVLVSIGELSEEAAESTNKNIKAFRLSNTRKMSRVLTNTDLLNRLLLNSDPFITGLRKLPKKKKTVLFKTVISLLDF